ncbi:hypothetical protein CW731_10680 [Polaribacter sp. ALD11]|uniref:hypothetical protein n=1 Tax=Polaribacter sp. ALD11 TaxID=2058137 RepID=UPI000C304DD0|nr:hypothetical protein [Polaribacter sp. ALD11]AUC85723.1 hypothetical protein CW731_10680 [Polaribacter sp. ALD11]
MKKKILILSLLFAFICSYSFSQDGKLDKAKESLKSTKSSESSGTRSAKRSKSSSTSTTNNSNDIENPFARIIWYAAAYTVYGAVFESPWEMAGRMSTAEISNYPYKESKYGNFVYTDATNYNITRFDVYNHFLIESKNLYGNDIGVDFRFLKRFALDINYTTFSEKVNGKRDSFNMFSTLLKYHRIRTQRFDAWFGLGFRRIFNDVKETRFLMGFGGELFIAKPISLVASHKWATVNSKSVRNTKLLLKYNIKNYRISSGYEHYKLGVSNINAFSIGVEASF